jgi:hypothetical protein
VFFNPDFPREMGLRDPATPLTSKSRAIAITALTGSSWAISGAFMLAVVGSVAARR